MRAAVAALLVLAVVVTAVPSPASRRAEVRSSLGELVEKYGDLLALQAPSGTYVGTTTVIGQKSRIEVDFESSSKLDMSFSGLVTGNCPGEAYSISGNTIKLTNVDSSSDCVNKALKEGQATLGAVTYNPSSDSITVNVKVLGVISLAIELKHTSAQLVEFEDDSIPALDGKNVEHLVEEYLELINLQAPAGTYVGSKTVLGQSATATVKIDSSTKMDFKLQGALSCDCPNEDYSLQGNKVVLPNIDTAGDCIHDALQRDGASFKSASYDPTTNTIQVSVKYAFLNIDVTLYHQGVSRTVNPSLAKSTSLTTKVKAFSPIFEFGDPSGSYSDSKKVLGQQVTVKVGFSSAGLHFQVSGVIALDCAGEPYTYSNGVITITNLGKSGDCVHDALSTYGASLRSFSYSGATDSVAVSIKVAILSIDFDLTHDAHVMEAPFAPPSTLGWLVKNYPEFALTASPSGDYKGTKTILGETVTGEVDIASSSRLSLKISGALELNCASEAYTYANGVITLVNTGSDDCVYKSLAEYNATLKPITFNDATNTIFVEVDVSFVKAKFTLNHQ